MSFLFKLPAINPNAKLLRPPVPILMNESNWPLLTVSKTLFEGAASSAKEGAAASMAAADVGDMGDEGGWGDSDLVIDEGKNQVLFLNEITW